LNVRIDPFVLKTAAPHINNNQACFVRRLQEDIFRLQITMNNLAFLEEIQAIKDLNRKPSNNL